MFKVIFVEWIGVVVIIVIINFNNIFRNFIFVI